MLPSSMTTRFRCGFPGCRKTYASTDGVRKHARKTHAQWLRDVDERSMHRDHKVYGNKPSTYCIREQEAESSQPEACLVNGESSSHRPIQLMPHLHPALAIGAAAVMQEELVRQYRSCLSRYALPTAGVNGYVMPNAQYAEPMPLLPAAPNSVFVALGTANAPGGAEPLVIGCEPPAKRARIGSIVEEPRKELSPPELSDTSSTSSTLSRGSFECSSLVAPTTALHATRILPEGQAHPAGVSSAVAKQEVNTPQQLTAALTSLPQQQPLHQLPLAQQQLPRLQGQGQPMFDPARQFDCSTGTAASQPMAEDSIVSPEEAAASEEEVANAIAEVVSPRFSSFYRGGWLDEQQQQPEEDMSAFLSTILAG